MPTPLERYFEAKAKKKPISPIAKRQAAAEAMGMPNSLIEKKSPGFFIKLLDLLDRPGNATRALLVGKLGGLKGLIPFAQTIENLTGLDVALNEDELVRGTEVIERWFGKQKQRKGKIDKVDVLGLLVEIVADPLWLVGAGVLTKTGKASKTVSSALKSFGAKNIDDLARIIAKGGKPANKHLTRAIRTLTKAGHKPELAKTWAQQAAKGQRALVSFGLPGRKATLIRGQRVLGGIDKALTKYRMGWLGQKLLAPYKRVSREHLDEISEIFTRLSSDVPFKERTRLSEKLGAIVHKLSKAGLDDKQTRVLLTDYIEAAGGIPRVAKKQKESIEHAIKLGKKKAIPFKKKLPRQQERLGKLAEKFKVAGKVPDRPMPSLLDIPKAEQVGIVPKIKGFGKKAIKPVIEPTQVLAEKEIGTIGGVLFDATPRGAKIIKSPQARRVARPLYNKIANLENKILKLKNLGTPKANAEIRNLQRQVEKLNIKGYIDRLKGINRKKIQQHTRLLAKDKARAGIRQAKVGRDIKHLEKQIASTKKRIRFWEETSPTIKGKAYRKRIAAREPILQTKAAETLGKIPAEKQPAFKEAAGELQQLTEKFLATEKKLGLRTGEIGSPIGYVRRLLTKDAQKFIDEGKLGTFRPSKRALLSPRHGGQLRRKKGIAHLLRDEIEEKFAKAGFKGEAVFEPDVITSTLVRGEESIKATGAARTIRETIKKFGKEADEITGRSFTVPELLKHKGLKNIDVESLENITKSISGGKSIPKEIADVLVNTYSASVTDDSLRGLSEFINNINSIYKGSLTTFFPAYHGRNAISNIFLNWIAGVKNPRAYAQAMQLQKAHRATQKLMKAQGLVWDDAVKKYPHLWPDVTTATGKVVPGYQVWDEALEHGILGRSLGMFGVEEAKATGRIGKKFEKVSKPFRQAGMAIEDNARLAHYLDKTSKGFNAADAAASAKHVLFDYGDLSPFEKKYLRNNTFLFYTFARKNLPLQVETLIQQPGKQALFSHLAGGTPTMQTTAKLYPDYNQERLVIPTPGGQIAGTGLPIEEAFGPLAGPGVGVFNRLRRMATRQGSRLAPIPKAGIELLANKNLFFDRPIQNVPRWVIQQTPVSRFAQTAGSIRREFAESPKSTAVKHLTGLKYRDYDPEQQRPYRIRDIARKILERDKRTRQFQRYYVPKDQRGELDEELQLALSAQ